MPWDHAPVTARTFAAALIAAAVAGAVQAQPTSGLLGQAIAAAERNDLFTFFNLAQTGREPCGDGQLLGFRPTGAQFHALASVTVATDAKGDVEAMILMLDRGFIDDPANGVFARDIAKSFLRDVSGPSAGPVIARLADEIEGAAAGAGTVIYRSGAAPAPPPGPPSAAYQAFLGGRSTFMATSGGEALGLVNGPQDGEAVLRISLSKTGPGPACAIGKVAG